MANNDNNTGSNRTSKWELSLYEKHRKPQQVITDDTEIAVTPRSLHSELMCPICLDILTNTMTTKECLHRFCHDCIITALRNTNKECPTCRKKLVSKRSLRRDPNFDLLISTIFPCRDEYENQHAALMQKLSENCNNSNNMQETLKRQATNRCRGKKANDDDNQNSNDTAQSGDSGDEQSENSSQGEEPHVKITLAPLPSSDQVLKSLKNRAIDVNQSATIQHVIKYMALRLEAENGRASPVVSSTTQDDDTDSPRIATPFNLYISVSPGEYRRLPHKMRLDQIASTLGQSNSFKLFYNYEFQQNS